MPRFAVMTTAHIATGRNFYEVVRLLDGVVVTSHYPVRGACYAGAAASVAALAMP